MVKVGVRINDGEPVMTGGPRNGDTPTPRVSNPHGHRALLDGNLHMTNTWRLSVLTAVLALAIPACQMGRTGNRQPAISSLTAYPDSMGPSDSTHVICIATDPDRDVLVYDWITDARLLIQGAPARDNTLYNTASNTHVFYPGSASLGVIDTGWVQCFARDGRGMSDARTVRILIHR
jgi:hypothetical protein